MNEWAEILDPERLRQLEPSAQLPEDLPLLRGRLLQAHGAGDGFEAAQSRDFAPGLLVVRQVGLHAGHVGGVEFAVDIGAEQRGFLSGVEGPFHIHSSSSRPATSRSFNRAA